MHVTHDSMIQEPYFWVNCRHQVAEILLFVPQLTFKRPSNDRNLSFEMISKEAQLPLEEVGKKNECARTVTLQYSLQPV